MDGDIDGVVGLTDGPPSVLRNNGDGTWLRTQPFAGISALRQFAWADLDQDADPDAMLVDGSGSLHVFTNRQAGQFSRAPEVVGVANVIAATVADLDADGTIDIVTLDAGGAVRKVSWATTAWSVSEIATWPGVKAGESGAGR
jgi:hypothetical protein